MTLIGRTKSFCPACGKVLAAGPVEKDGAAFMSERCPAHGLSGPKVAAAAREVSATIWPGSTVIPEMPGNWRPAALDGQKVYAGETVPARLS